MKMTRELLNIVLKKCRISDTTVTIIPKLKLKDGESISVQAGRTHYCSPRDDDGPYYQVEIGYPSISPGEDWRDYFDGDYDTEDHTKSVYGYVPLELVVDFINNHGGFIMMKEILKEIYDDE